MVSRRAALGTRISIVSKFLSSDLPRRNYQRVEAGLVVEVEDDHGSEVASRFADSVIGWNCLTAALDSGAPTCEEREHFGFCG